MLPALTFKRLRDWFKRVLSFEMPHYYGGYRPVKGKNPPTGGGSFDDPWRTRQFTCRVWISENGTGESTFDTTKTASGPSLRKTVENRDVTPEIVDIVLAVAEARKRLDDALQDIEERRNNPKDIEIGAWKDFSLALESVGCKGTNSQDCPYHRLYTSQHNGGPGHAFDDYNYSCKLCKRSL